MGSRQEAAQESHIQRHTLDDPDLRAALKAFSKLLSTSMGPHGRIQSIQNGVGGPITMTTSSSRLLSALSFSRPCLRLIVSSVQGHLRNYHDGGLLAGSLCLRLVLNAVEVESIGRKCVREVYEVLLKLIDEYLTSDDCAISVNVDISNVKVMLAFVKSILASKPVCGLRLASASHLAQLVLKAFLNSVPDVPASFLTDRVFTLQFDKKDITSSEVMEGLLLEWPEKSAALGAQELPVIRESSKGIRVALVIVSMSGDAEEFLTNQMEAQPQIVQSAADLVLKQMLAFCDWLREKRVDVLLCQKVIHPKVKTYLRQKGIVFVERLGIQPVAYIQDLTGSRPISSVIVPPPESALGWLNSVTHRAVHNKGFLHLQKSNSHVCTLLLCGAVDEQLAELKSVVQSALKGLYSTLQRPVALCGGGCWQIHLASYVRRVVREREDKLCSQLRVTRAQLAAATNAFASSFESTALSLLSPSFRAWVDPQHCHMWHVPEGVDLAAETTAFSCACGIVTDADIDTSTLQPLLGRDNSVWRDGIWKREHIAKIGCLGMKERVNPDWLVLDTLDCVVSAVRTAAMTATTVLSITQFIHDVN